MDLSNNSGNNQCIIVRASLSRATATYSLYVQQVDEMYREAPIKNAMFDYVEFTRILKHGAKDLEDQWDAAAAAATQNTFAAFHL